MRPKSDSVFFLRKHKVLPASQEYDFPVIFFASGWKKKRWSKIEISCAITKWLLGEGGYEDDYVIICGSIAVSYSIYTKEYARRRLLKNKL